MMMQSEHWQTEETRSPMSEINTTPLVDVMLVLLVIFIITAPLLTHAINIDLPNATSQTVQQTPEVIDLALDAQGQLFWNDMAIAPASLAQQMRQAATQSPMPVLQIRADKHTEYQQLAEVLAIAQAAGMSHIGFLSTPSDLGSRPKKIN